VEQLASSTENYQKWITNLINLHLRKLGQDVSVLFTDDKRKDFDIGKFV